MGSQFANAAYNDNSTYSYDNTNQLAGADHSAIGDESYTYDANGNRTNTGYQTGTGNNNQLSSDGTDNYTYDNEGNLKTRTEIATGKVREFTWDYRHRLTGVTDKTAGTVTQQVSYTYDALNQRLAKTVGTQTTCFVYDRGNVYLEFSGTNTTSSTRYLYGPMVDQVLAQESNGQTTWMLTDHLGSVRDLVNNSGAVVNHFTYDSFGQVVGSTAGATVDTRYKFTGREYDSETGLYYYRARYFDAGVGRFIGQDPIGFGAGDSNLYRYVGNSPLNATDPSGLRGLTQQEQLTMNMLEGLAYEARTDKLERVAGPKFSRDLLAAKGDLLRSIGAVKQGMQDPPSLKAILWSLNVWNNAPTSYSYMSGVPDRGLKVRFFKREDDKCNRFVGDAYAIGAGVGYDINGKGGSYPTGQSWLPFDPRSGYPAGADRLGSSSSATGDLTNLRLTSNPKVGDIIAFPDGNSSHTGLLFGHGLYISSRRGPSLGNQVDDGVMITNIPFNHAHSFRSFQP